MEQTTCAADAKMGRTDSVVTRRPRSPSMTLSDLHDIRDAFVQCRMWSHMWDPIPPPPVGQHFGAGEHLRCTRCGTIRFGRFSPFTGERMGGLVYLYPEGYSAVGTYTRAEWRKEGNKRDFFQSKKKPSVRRLK